MVFTYIGTTIVETLGLFIPRVHFMLGEAPTQTELINPGLIPVSCNTYPTEVNQASLKLKQNVIVDHHGTITDPCVHEKQKQRRSASPTPKRVYAVTLIV